MNNSTREVTIYTDGACLGNPGPGGYAAILIYGKNRRETLGGFRLTTNNRMEIMAAIAALECLKTECRVTLSSDSQYLIQAVEQGWIEKWKANDWRKKGKGQVLNSDLWERLLPLVQKHQVVPEWVRGHVGNKENERCDYLAVSAANQMDLAVDQTYEHDHPELATSIQSIARPRADAQLRVPDVSSRKILAVLDYCRDDADAKKVDYDDSEGFVVYASTKFAAWRYDFRSLKHAYEVVTSGASVRSYRRELG